MSPAGTTLSGASGLSHSVAPNQILQPLTFFASPAIIWPVTVWIMWKVRPFGAINRSKVKPLTNVITPVQSSSTTARTRFAPGTLIAQYRVLAILGAGGMGVVYKAEDSKLGRIVALKFLPETLSAEDLALKRFQREARAASALNHSNICTIYDIDDLRSRM